MEQQRNLEVKLQFTGDPSKASQAMRQLQQDAKNLDKAAQDAQRSLDRVNGKRGGGPGGGGTQPPATGHGDGGLDIKAMKDFTGKLAAGAAIVTAAATAVDSFTKAIAGFSQRVDSGGRDLSSGQHALRVFYEGLGDIPLAGDVMRMGARIAENVVDMLPGRLGGGQLTAARRNAQNDALRLDRLGPMIERDRELEAIRNRGRSSQINAEYGRAFATQELLLSPITARNMLDNPEVTTALSGQRRASAEMQAARKNAIAADMATFQAQRRVEAARLNRDRVYAKNQYDPENSVFGSMANTARLEDTSVAQRRREAELHLLEAQNQLKEALNKKEQTATELAQKKLDLSKAELEVDKARLSKLDEELQKQKSAAIEFGSTGVWDKLGVRNSLRRAQELGFGAISAEERNLLLTSSATQEYARKQAMEVGKNDPILQEINQMLGQSGFENLQQRKAELQAKIIVNTAVAEAELKNSLEKVVDSVSDKFIKIAKEVFEGKLNIIDAKRAEERALGAGGGQ